MVCEGIIEPEKFTPTERAGFMDCEFLFKLFSGRCLMKSLTWIQGWKLENCILSTIPTDKEVAPPNILQVIRCKCKPSMKNPCGTNVCSCRKNGLKCMPAGGGCREEDCNNHHVSLLN